MHTKHNMVPYQTFLAKTLYFSVCRAVGDIKSENHHSIGAPFESDWHLLSKYDTKKRDKSSINNRSNPNKYIKVISEASLSHRCADLAHKGSNNYRY